MGFPLLSTICLALTDLMANSALERGIADSDVVAATEQRGERRVERREGGRGEGAHDRRKEVLSETDWVNAIRGS